MAESGDFEVAVVVAYGGLCFLALTFYTKDYCEAFPVDHEDDHDGVLVAVTVTGSDITETRIGTDSSSDTDASSGTGTETETETEIEAESITNTGPDAV
jgi:hypothetical protein